MSNSRRVAFAAALVAVVVGSLGLVSTLNAGAEQVPAPAPVTESTTPEGAAEIRPPARLPWGSKPRNLDTGADGAGSQLLKSAGLDAAAPRGKQPAEKFAPKGKSSRAGTLRSAPTEIIPPKPPATSLASQTAHFHYNVGSQATVTDGAYANFSINRPTLATADYHTLAELAVQSGDGNQIVEVGWNVDRVVNGDSDPHLFVFHWVNGQPTCYNGCGFVQYSQNVSPGDTLPQDVTKRLGIQFYNGAWWVAYDTEWVGYYPASRWNGNFTQTGMVQVFGEVAAASAVPCTAMGNGLHGASDASSARIGSVSFINGPAVNLYVRSTSNPYDVAQLSGRTFRYGGPGAC